MSPRSRRLLGYVLVALAAAVLAVPVLATDGRAGASERDQRNGITVTQVDGLIDPPNAQLIRSSIDEANRRRVSLLVLRIDSGGSVDIDIGPVVRAIRRSKVPIAVWIGPSRAKGKGAAAVLLEAAPVASVASGASVGPAYPEYLDRPSAVKPAGQRVELGALAGSNGRNPSGGRAIVSRRLSADEARRLGAVDSVEPTLGELIVSLDGRQVHTAAGSVTLSTAKVVGEGRDRRRETNQTVRFRKLTLGGTAVHTLTSPSIAYLLFVAGLALIVFEFFTAAIGLAGLTGAVAVVGALVGFSHLPVSWWAAALLMVGVLGFAIDVQAGGLGFWTVAGAISLVVGSITLYNGSSRLDVVWWVVTLVCAGTAVFMLAGMTAAIRSRFSTPTVGREQMVGEMGKAEVDVAPDGVVRVRGALWRARTNRATPIGAGASIRVVSVEGLVLEVEPDEGGAKDYRH